MKNIFKRAALIIPSVSCMVVVSVLFTGCATQQGYQGASIGAMTGATAGILLDPDNRWRGAVIGGGLGATLGGVLTDRPAYRQQQYYDTYYSPHQQRYQSQSYTAKGTLIGGATGAAAGAFLDHNNRWRGSLIGGALGGIFGGSISNINNGPSVPILSP